MVFFKCDYDYYRVSTSFEPIDADLDAPTRKDLLSMSHGHVGSVNDDGPEVGDLPGARHGPGQGALLRGGEERGLHQAVTSLLQQELLGVNNLGLLEADEFIEKIILKKRQLLSLMSEYKGSLTLQADRPILSSALLVSSSAYPSFSANSTFEN